MRACEHKGWARCRYGFLMSIRLFSRSRRTFNRWLSLVTQQQSKIKRLLTRSRNLMKRGDLWTAAGGGGCAPKLRPVLIVQDDRFDTADSVTKSRPASPRSLVAGQGALRPDGSAMSGTTDTVLTDAITKHQPHYLPGTSNGSAHTPGLGASSTTSGAARVNSGLAGIANHPPGASLPGERQERESDDLQSSEEVKVVPLTTVSREAPLLRLAVEVNDSSGLQEESYLMIDKVTTVHRSKLGQRVGKVGDEGMSAVNKALMVFLGMV